MEKINLPRAIFLAMILLFSSSLIFLHLLDKTHLYNWQIFYGWLVSFSLAVWIAVYGQLSVIFSKLAAIIKTDSKPLLLILCFAVITRFLFLGQYPYPYMGDGIRDGGLYAMDIQNGNIKDVFGFGAYNGYGLFVPLVSSYFLPIFPNSPYTFLVPAALASIVGILLLYTLCRLWYGKRTAIIAAFFLISSPFNLHYSRYELLMALDSPLALLMILATFASTKFLGGFLLAGLTFGLAFHFYASLRGFAIACLIYLFLYNIRKIVFHIAHRKSPYKTLLVQNILGIILVVTGMYISIGPTFNNLIRNKAFTHVGTQTLIFSTESFSKLSISKKA